MKKRRGKIRVSKYFLREDLESCLLVFANFIPIYINDNPWDNYIEYTGYSNLFDEIEESSVKPIPEYMAVMENKDDKVQFLKFEKIL